MEAYERARVGMTSAEIPILIVDDNAVKRTAMKAVLAPLGLAIVEAESGVAALRCVMAQDFAVILLDVCMPVTDGFQTAALIRRRRQSEWTPIIFVTGYANDEITASDHYAEGAVDFIYAPVPPDELRSKVAVFAKIFTRARELAERALDVQKSAEQLRVLTDAAPIGIFQTNARNEYVYTNPRWSAITGISAEDAAGQKPVDHADTDDADSASGHGEFSHRIEIRVAGEAPRIALVTSTSIPDPDGGIAGWVGTLADVTAEAGAEAAMSAGRDAALEANAMQRNFAASASHELRTPTTSILGYTEEVLESEDLSETDRGFLNVVHRNAQRLTQLIDDLLILDRAEIGPSMMHPEPTPVAPLVERVVATFSGTAEHADIALTTHCANDVPPALVDPLRLEQALNNLVSNAVKFTPSGGEIKVDVARRDESVEISVTDTGAGIDPADIEHIFGRFYRAKAAVDAAIKGSGLGLAIAQRMIEAQNGQMRVTSELGRGSTFTVTVPAAARELQLA